MKLRLLTIFMMLFTSAFVYSAGLTQHQFMSEIAAGLVITPELKDCLKANKCEYIVGASFPDAGYASLNDPLSEICHTQKFIDAFVTHIQESYHYPYLEKYKLISFMMGTGSHVADDPPYHQYFIAESAKQDFNGNYELAHFLCDSGLDFLTLVDYCQWFDMPVLWVPVHDIIETLKLMGYSYSGKDVVLGNSVLYVAAIGERLIAGLVYLPLRLVMPWTSQNYYDYPFGGLYNGGETARDYYEVIWEDLMSQQGSLDLSLKIAPERELKENQQLIFDFARNCIEADVVKIKTVKSKDGAVLIGPMKVMDEERFRAMLKQLAADILQKINESQAR